MLWFVVKVMLPVLLQDRVCRVDLSDGKETGSGNTWKAGLTGLLVEILVDEEERGQREGLFFHALYTRWQVVSLSTP